MAATQQIRIKQYNNDDENNNNKNQQQPVVSQSYSFVKHIL